MVNETIQYYTENGGNPVYLLLLDATKAFDKVSYKVLFDVLLDKKVCNLLISDFRVCDSITLDSLHKRYCMHMYGSELWNLNCRYVDEFKVAWRKVKRQIWRLPSNTHNVIIQNLTYNIDDQLDARMAKFIHMCLNHDNTVCRSISLSKLLCCLVLPLQKVI